MTILQAQTYVEKWGVVISVGAGFCFSGDFYFLGLTFSAFLGLLCFFGLLEGKS